MKIVFLVGGLFVWLGLDAQMLRDTLYLLNGTVVVGKLKSIKLGIVTFDPDDANDITVQLRRVRALAAVMKVYRVETTDNQVRFGTIRPCPEAGYAAISGGGGMVKVQMEAISVLYPFRDDFLQRFSGNASAGFDYTRSSNLGRINLESTVNYKAKKVEISLSVSGTYTITDSSISRDREDAALKYNHYFTTNWFGTVFLRTQRNLELGLLRRYQEGFGGGNKFITARHVYAWTRLGMVLNQEKNTEEEKSGTLAELFSQWEFDFFRYTIPKVTFGLAETFYYSLSQAGRLRNDLSLDLTWEIVKDLNLSLSAYANFDSKPSSEESKKLDYGTVFRIGVIF